MALRTIQAPGIQVNEIDRSQYGNKVDYSLPNSPYCFIAGFADKGDDYTVYSVPTREALIDKYGQPQNEAERYFYNGCLEVLNRGAKLLTVKLPYCNNSMDKYSYVDYKIDPNLYPILTDQQILGKWNTVNQVREVLRSVLQDDTILEILGEAPQNIETLPDMRNVVFNILNSNTFKFLKDNFEYQDQQTQRTVVNQFYNFYYDYIYDTADLVTQFEAIKTQANLSFSMTSTDPDFVTFEQVEKFIETLNIIHTKQADVTTGNVNISQFYAKYTEFLATPTGKDFEDNIKNAHLHTLVLTVDQLRIAIQQIVSALNDSHPYIDLKLNDSDITSYCNIVPDIDSTTGRARSGMITTDQLDDYLTNDYTQIQNKIRIVDMTRHQYDPTSFDTVKSTLSDENGQTYSIYTNDCLGIVPVVVAPTNALYFQCLIDSAHSNDYNGIANFNSTMTTNPNVDIQINKNTILSNLYIDLKNNEGDLPTKETLSKMVADCFPQIERANPQHYDQEHFKKIGIVVLSAFIDNANNKKLNFKILESFVGSLDKYARSTSDNSSIFIDNVVNNNSNYIKCFSAANTKTVRQASIIALKNQTATSLGFYKLDCEKNINTQKSILTPVKKILEIMQDPRGYQIDMIIDAGLTNIGQYLEGVNKKYSSLIDLNERPPYWYAIASIFDNFCKFVRKDCVYLLDGPRPFCLEGEQKIVRRTKPTNTILNNIIPKLKYMTGMNSSYTVGYCNWFKCTDDFTKDVYWCPPSIKAAGIYCYTDVYFHKWDAPAGMNRGKVIDVLDTAFSPTNDEAGRLYTQCWNYAVNYPVDGIVIEGQRTFQRKATALDRVNVRRLMIHLEKETVNIAKYYLYEGHTAYLRERFVNALTPIFENAVNGYGISDYIIKCDAENNPTIAIERNELHCSIAVKPIKAVEFIVLNFIVTNQSASVSEEVSR